MDNSPPLSHEERGRSCGGGLALTVSHGERDAVGAADALVGAAVELPPRHARLLISAASGVVAVWFRGGAGAACP